MRVGVYDVGGDERGEQDPLERHLVHHLFGVWG